MLAYELNLREIFKEIDFNKENFVTFPKYGIIAGYILKQSSSINTQV